MRSYGNVGHAARPRTVVRTGECDSKLIYALNAKFPGASIDITLDPNFVMGECEWCVNEFPGAACVRVTGEPAFEIHEPVILEEACLLCAVTLIERALAEQDPNSRREIMVEVAR